MLILLPPSEGKQTPAPTSGGSSLDLAGLSFSELTRPRAAVVRELVKLSSGTPKRALRLLGLSPGQIGELAINSTIESAPTAPAQEIYTGVLFAALDLPGYSAQQSALATDRVLITSSVFGFVRPTDLIPAYRLSGSVTLPRIGKVSAHWRKNLTRTCPSVLTDQLIVDFRSGTYVGFWPLPKNPSRPSLTVKIWQQGPGGVKTAVSHHNKAVKGELARFLATTTDSPQSPEDVAECCRGAGWNVALEAESAAGNQRLDVLT